MNNMATRIKDAKGKEHDIELTKTGKVSVKEIRKIDAERSEKARKSDKKSVSRTVYPKTTTVEMAQKWAKNPGMYDIQGVDAPDDAVPSHTLSKQYKYVYDAKGKRHRVPIDKYEKATKEYLQYVNNGRSEKSKQADSRRAAKTIYMSNPDAYMAYDWAKNPSAKDIEGIDSPEGVPHRFEAPKRYEKKTAKKVAEKPVKETAKPKKAGTKKTAMKKTASAPKPAVTAPVQASGYEDFNLSDRDFDMFIELENGMVVEMHHTLDESFEGDDYADNIDFTIYDHGVDHDGGRLQYSPRDRLSDFEHFVEGGNKNYGFKRIITRSGSPEYDELLEALENITHYGDRTEYDRIKGTYGLQNMKPVRSVLFRRLGQ